MPLLGNIDVSIINMVTNVESKIWGVTWTLDVEKWLEASISFRIDDEFVIVMETSSTAAATAYVAVDDLDLRVGDCASKLRQRQTDRDTEIETETD